MDRDYYNYTGYTGYHQPAITYGQYLSRTFRWMTAGLLLTFAVACTVAYTGLIYTVARLYLPLTIAELALVIVLGARVHHMQVNTARLCFLGYSALNGLVMSIYFTMFDMRSLVMAFLAAGLYFGIMAVYGLRTARDLSGWGSALRAGLIALLVCSVLGLLFGMGLMASLVYSAIGLGLFMLITARDTQMLERWYDYFSGDDAMLEKSAVYGALELYLDFINIFLYLVRFMGRSRD